MAFQNNVFIIDRAYPGGFAGAPFYPAKGAVNDMTANIPCIFGNFCFYVGGSENVAGGQTKGPLAGLVLSSSQGVSYDANVIYTDTTVNAISPGQIVEFAVRGSYFVQLSYLGTGNVTKDSPIWARLTDGAIGMGITTESGWIQTNFFAMDNFSFNVLNGLIKISNTEKVTP